MYDYNCPDCNEAKLQSDKNARKINEVIDQVNALIQVNNETVDFIEEKANEVVEEIAEIKVNEVLGDIKTSLDNMANIETITDLKNDDKNLLMNKTYDFTGNIQVDNCEIVGFSNTIFNGVIDENIEITSKNIKFKNIIFQNYNQIAISGGNIAFENCTFKSFGKNAILTNGANITIKNCNAENIGIKEGIQVAFEGCFLYAQQSNCIIENNTITRTRGQGALLFNNSKIINCSKNVIHDTAYRGIECYGANTRGEISYNTIYNTGTINNTNSGVGCNGIFGGNNPAMLEVDVIGNIIFDVYENGIEGKFKLVKDNLIRNTGIKTDTHPTPSIEGIWCSGENYINNTIINPKGAGIRLVSTSNGISNKTIKGNKIIKGENTSSENGIELNSSNQYDSNYLTVCDNEINGFDYGIRTFNINGVKNLFSGNKSDKQIYYLNGTSAIEIDNNNELNKVPFLNDNTLIELKNSSCTFDGNIAIFQPTNEYGAEFKIPCFKIGDNDTICVKLVLSNPNNEVMIRYYPVDIEGVEGSPSDYTISKGGEKTIIVSRSNVSDNFKIGLRWGYGSTVHTDNQIKVKMFSCKI